MEKSKKVLLFFIIASLLVISILYGIYAYKKSNIAGDTFYYSYTCSHCKNVEDFMVKNDITSKVFFQQKEVSQNPTNAQELIKVGNKCKLPQEKIGTIPLLYYNGLCYSGDTDIINFLNKTFNNK